MLSISCLMTMQSILSMRPALRLIFLCCSMLGSSAAVLSIPGKQQTDAVRAGTIFGSITQAPYSQGYDIVKYAVDYLNGEDIPASINATYYFYNAQNIDDPEIAQCLYD